MDFCSSLLISQISNRIKDIKKNLMSGIYILIINAYIKMPELGLLHMKIGGYMKNKKLRKLMLIAMVFILLFAVVGCTQKGEEDIVEEPVSDVDNSLNSNEDIRVEDFSFGDYYAELNPEAAYTPSEGLPIVKIEIKDGAPIILELYPEIAPNTVNNFLSLARTGFYDGLIYHRVMKDFMIQGGDPLGTGAGNPGYSIDGEFSNNGFDNTISHVPGVISMARSRDFNSAGSQFFIVHGDATFLDGDYAGFGKVFYGMEEVDRIANVDVKKEKPEEDVVMESIRIDLNGYEFSEPVVNK